MVKAIWNGKTFILNTWFSQEMGGIRRETMPLKEIYIQNSTESKKDLGYCGCHVIKFAIQLESAPKLCRDAKVAWGVVKWSATNLQGCRDCILGPVSSMWSIHWDFCFPISLLGGWKVPCCILCLLSLVLSQYVSLCLCFLHGPLLICNLSFRDHSPFRGKEWRSLSSWIATAVSSSNVLFP